LPARMPPTWSMVHGFAHLLLAGQFDADLPLGDELDDRLDGLDLGQVRRDIAGRHRMVAKDDVVGVQPVASQPGVLSALQGLLPGLVRGIVLGGTAVPEVLLRAQFW